MKIRFISMGCCLCALTALPAKAQLQDQRHNFSLGVNGGANVCSVSFEPTVEEGKLIGPTFGLTARYVSEKYFKMICGIQAELNYSQRGWKEVLEEGMEGSYQRTMNYVEIPVMAHMAFGKDKGNGARFVLNLGPQIGFMLNEKEKITGNPAAQTSRPTSQYGKMAETKFDYGLIGGGGLEIRTGIGHFIMEARYYFGLSDFYHSTKKDPFSRSAHSYIAGKLTYLFDLTK